MKAGGLSTTKTVQDSAGPSFASQDIWVVLALLACRLMLGWRVARKERKMSSATLARTCFLFSTAKIIPATGKRNREF